MNKNIDLTKILKDLEGIELWSSLMGEKCILKQICPQNKYDCIVLAVKGNGDETREEYSFKKDGSYGIPGNGECLVFPSKDQRDWSKFKKPIKKGTPIVYHYDKLNTWCIGKYAGYEKGKHYIHDLYNDDYPVTPDYIILYNKFNPLKIKECIKKYNIQNNFKNK